MELLTFEHVGISYHTQGRTNVAAEDISFSVNEGDYFCLVGHNGSGKSSLVRGALGLIPLAGGSIRYSLARQEVGYLPQTSCIERDFPISVEELVLTGTIRHGGGLFYTRPDRQTAGEMLERMGLELVRHKSIGSLSGGQQQRALLARALCRRPNLLFLDEPCNGLDEGVSQDFYLLLKEMNRQQGVTVVAVSHDLEQVARDASRVAVLDTKLRFCGPVEEWRQSGNWGSGPQAKN